MRKQHLILGLMACSAWTAAGAAMSAGVQARVDQQNALFDEYYETELKNWPEMATAFGDYRYNDRLNDYSLNGINGEHQRNVDLLDRLKKISTAGFPEQDALSHQVLLQSLEQRLWDYDLKKYKM